MKTRTRTRFEDLEWRKVVSNTLVIKIALFGLLAQYVGCGGSGDCYEDIQMSERKCEFGDADRCSEDYPGCYIVKTCRPIPCQNVNEEERCNMYSHCSWWEPHSLCEDIFEEWPDCVVDAGVSKDVEDLCRKRNSCTVGDLCSGTPLPCSELKKQECNMSKGCIWRYPPPMLH
jgi:hypothetical protein